MEVEYIVRVKREVDDEESVEAGRQELARIMEAQLKEGTYEVEALAREDQSPVPLVDKTKFKTVKDLNHEVRNLAHRTVAALSALGLGQRGTLVASWQALTEESALSERLDAELKARLTRLDHLAELIGKATSVLDNFESVKRDLDRTWDAIERETTRT